MEKKKKVVIVAWLLVLLMSTSIYAFEDRKLYSMGVEAASAGKKDLAFIHFDSLVRKFPNSKLSEYALFAIGEYYYAVADLRDSDKIFNEFIKSYPDSKAKIFALAYLLEMAKSANKKSQVKEIEKEIMGLKRTSFLFKTFKSYKYTSALRVRHKVLYSADKIEFFIDGKLFTTLSY